MPPFNRLSQKLNNTKFNHFSDLYIFQNTKHKTQIIHKTTPRQQAVLESPRGLALQKPYTLFWRNLEKPLETPSIMVESHRTLRICVMLISQNHQEILKNYLQFLEILKYPMEYPGYKGKYFGKIRPLPGISFSKNRAEINLNMRTENLKYSLFLDGLP